MERVEQQAPLGYGGQGFSLKGEKDRFVLPPEFRKSVIAASEGENKLCLVKHHRWPCLIGFGTLSVHAFDRYLNEEEAKHPADAEKPFDREKRMSALWKHKPVTFDDSGRFLIPEALTILGKMGGEIYFTGGSPFFFLWNPEELEKMGQDFDDDRVEMAILRREALTKGRKK